MQTETNLCVFLQNVCTISLCKVILYFVYLLISEQVHLSEREKQKLQVWSRIMPYRESFAWAIVPLFDNNIGAVSGGSASPSSPLATSVSGSSSHEGMFEPISKITLDGKLGYSSGSSIVVEISNLNKVKESYTEESLQVWWWSALLPF